MGHPPDGTLHRSRHGRLLEVYDRPRDPEAPVVCLDERSNQLIAETRVPIAVKRGTPAGHDYEVWSERGRAHLFMMFAPLERLAAC